MVWHLAGTKSARGECKGPCQTALVTEAVKHHLAESRNPGARLRTMTAKKAQNDLFRKLRNTRQESVWCRKNFVPQDKFAELITPEAIRACLPNATANLLRYVREQALKLFAILLSVRREDSLYDLMEQLSRFDVTDSHLPLAQLKDDDALQRPFDSWSETLREDFFVGQ